jgi:SAM-dependent methyltransferase
MEEPKREEECVAGTRYFDHDFDYDDWALECATRYLLPDISEASVKEDLARDWEGFYQTHDNGQFFKSRKYLSKEFESWLERSQLVLEVGCGYGCSIYPLLEAFPCLNFIATDYSVVALEILRGNRNYNPQRISVHQWDVTLPPDPVVVGTNHIDAVLMIFALSAVHPSNHLCVMLNLSSSLPEGSFVLFRDYGVHDMTMYRHSIRHSENLFERSDGTLSYYFDLPSFVSLAQAAAFSVIEIKYATIINRNRKTGVEMRRVFVHAVLQKDLREPLLHDIKL